MQTNTVAVVIASQIGNRALAMMGAKNLMSDAGSLTFRVGSNPKRVTHVSVTLSADDTYEVSFSRVSRSAAKPVVTVAKLDGVYCDQLNRAIEANTGLYLSL